MDEGDCFFVEDTQSDAVRATSKGIEAFEKPFARAGHNIRSVKNRRQLKMAVQESEPFILQAIIQEFEERGKQNPQLMEAAEEIRRILDRPTDSLQSSHLSES